MIETFLKEIKLEAATTRKMLQRVPDEKFDWQPHPKSMSLKRLATHVAELPGWVPMTLNTSELDFAVSGFEPKVEINNNADLLAYFENNLEECIKSLGNAIDAQLDEPWTLRNGSEIYSTSPKEDVIRMSISQSIHHRAQLGVFLRLLDVPIPGSYGPSADETDF